MPIRPRRSHPIRTVRKILGKTQAQLGALVGVSAIAIKRIENGGLILSDKLAARISAATGMPQIELLKGSKGKAVDMDGKSYTPKTFQQWNQHWNQATPEIAEDRADELGEFIKLVCLASASGGRPNLRSVYAALGAAIDGVCRDYGLEARMAALFEEKGVTKKKLPKGEHYFVVNPPLSLFMENTYHRLGKPNPYPATTASLLQESKKSC